MDAVGWSWTSAYSYLVGYSPGGPSSDPGSIDLSAPGLSHLVHGADVEALHLAASARPVQGTAISLSLQNVPNGASLGGVVFGLTDPALDLASFGMPGCTLYAAPIATVVFPIAATRPVVLPITRCCVARGSSTTR